MQSVWKAGKTRFREAGPTSPGHEAFLPPETVRTKLRPLQLDSEMTKRGLKEARSKSGHIKGKLVSWKRLSVGSQKPGVVFSLQRSAGESSATRFNSVRLQNDNADLLCGRNRVPRAKLFWQEAHSWVIQFQR